MGSETGIIYFLPFNQEGKLKTKMHFQLGNYIKFMQCFKVNNHENSFCYFSYVRTLKQLKLLLSGKKSIFLFLAAQSSSIPLVVRPSVRLSHTFVK